MAKLRVYELAKELDMPNKDLVDKIGSLGIQIKGHMSSLDEEEAQLVRDTVTGKSQQLIVEKRVRRGVIRRRRKVVKAEPSKEPVEAEITPEAAPPVETPAEIQLEEGAPTEEPLEEELPTVVDEELTPEAEAKVAEEAKVEKKVKKKVKKPRRRVKKEPAAKIIKLPERAKEVAPEEEVKPEEKTEPPAVEPTVPLVAPEPEAEKKPAKAKKKKGKRARVEEETAESSQRGD
jgi:translation initiation factor IF-2